MFTKLDKRDRAALFRDRLAAAMASAGSSRSALARDAGVNRSTISQLLDEAGDRLPGGHLAAECAAALGVSADWLLGLTDRPERPGDAIAAAIQFQQAERTPADDQLLAWYREAAGCKIRHVPQTLPDMLKTETVLRWEYAGAVGKTTDQAVAAMQERLELLHARSSDHEIACPLHELDALARGEGYYRGLDREARAAQLERLRDLARAHYPSLRLFFYDARRVYSAPITVFGTLVAAVYVGRFYLAFREGARLRSLIEHFDQLICEAQVDARDAPAHLEDLLRRVV